MRRRLLRRVLVATFVNLDLSMKFCATAPNRPLAIGSGKR